MSRPLFLLGIAVALVVSVSSAFLQVETVKPPFIVEATDPIVLDQLTNRQTRIAQVMRANDTERLERLNINEVDREAAEQRIQAEADIAMVRAAAKEALGPAYTGTFINGTVIIVTATTAGIVPGAASVVQVPHSLRQLRRIRHAIERQIEAHNLGDVAGARIVRRQADTLVHVCALDDAPLDLSEYPSSAVRWTGACRDRS